MNSIFSKAHEFSLQVREFLQERVREGQVQSFCCTFEPSLGISSTIISGMRRSKAPAHESFESELTLTATLASGNAFMLEFTGLSFRDFIAAYETASRLAAPLKHDSKLQRHHSYPEVELAVPELLKILENGSGLQPLDTLVNRLDASAARVKNPRLMSREVNAHFEAAERHYFDSLGNNVSELTTHTDASVAFSLSDSSEYQHDAFGSLPSDAELDHLVEEAARGVVPIAARRFEPQADTAVLLTPRAFATLADDLLLPNVDARTLIDGSGAWDLKKLFQNVLPGITIRDNPLLPLSPFSQRFDAEGTPSKPVVIMDKGRLVHPLLTSALLDELRSKNPPNIDSFTLTGHASSQSTTDETNLFIELDSTTVEPLDTLRRAARQVVVINNLTGSSSDSITGQFALDAEGAKVYRDGELLYSTNITLRGNFLDALTDPGRRAGPQERVFDTHVPWLLTNKLSCVAKRLANEEN